MGPAVCVPSPSQQQRRNEKTGRRSVGSVALRAQGRHFYLVSQGTLKKQFTFDIYIFIFTSHLRSKTVQPSGKNEAKSSLFSTNTHTSHLFPFDFLCLILRIVCCHHQKYRSTPHFFNFFGSCACDFLLRCLLFVCISAADDG